MPVTNRIFEEAYKTIKEGINQYGVEGYVYNGNLDLHNLSRSYTESHSLLLVATLHNDLQSIQWLQRNNLIPDAESFILPTPEALVLFNPLHYAVSNRNIEIVNLLLDINPNFNTQNNVGLTPAHIAASQNNEELFARLYNGPLTLENIRSEAEQIVRNITDDIFSAPGQEVYRLETIIDLRVLDIHTFQFNGLSALGAGIRTEDMDVIEYLVELGCRIPESERGLIYPLTQAGQVSENTLIHIINTTPYTSEELSQIINLLPSDEWGGFDRVRNLITQRLSNIEEESYSHSNAYYHEFAAVNDSNTTSNLATELYQLHEGEYQYPSISGEYQYPSISGEYIFALSFSKF